MNVADEARKALASGFLDIIEQFDLPGEFPPEVISETSSAISSFSTHPKFFAGGIRRDATDIPLVTLDPASSTDLDQAFALSKEGSDIVLSYALADVGAFVVADGLIEKEAWRRGLTIYGLNEKIPLYPKPISQGAASLLPDGMRPAILVVVSIRPDGEVSLRSIEKVLCISRAKLAYDSIDINSIPFLEEFAKRMWDNETRRGSIRVEFPQQEIVGDSDAPGGVRLELRGRNYAESVNSTLSLAVNLAIGTLFKEAGVGLFRVMDDPTPRATSQLRRSAHALGIQWSQRESLRDLQSRMDPNDLIHQRFLLEARRSGGRAEYAAFNPTKTPWHSAIAATYAHATAPMRRLADRYALDLAVLLANNLEIPGDLLSKMDKLPGVMSRFESRANNVDRSVIDLLEAVSLQHRVGEVLTAEIIDAESSTVQTRDSAIRSKVLRLPRHYENGQFIQVRIEAADPIKRRITLVAVE